MTVWKNERPSWCPHLDCQFLKSSQAMICAGQLPEPVEHDGDFNTHRWCMFGCLPNNEVFDLQVNKTDLYHFRRIFEAIDGRKTIQQPPQTNPGDGGE